MSFASLGLSEELVRAVTERGYTEPTPIQAQAIPAVLSGGDLLAGAQTGTGKTAGFVLPILQRLSEKHSRSPAEGRSPIRVLMLTPTRELAAQVEESVREYGKHLKISSMVMFGGVNINPQITRLRGGRVDVLVATPGRLLDHVYSGRIDFGDSFEIILEQQRASDKDNILIHGISGTAQREGVPPLEAMLAFLEYLGTAPLIRFHITFEQIMIKLALL